MILMEAKGKRLGKGVLPSEESKKGLAFYNADCLTQTCWFFFRCFLRRAGAGGFYADEGFVTVIWHIRHADRKRRAWVPAHDVDVVMVNYVNFTI